MTRPDFTRKVLNKHRDFNLLYHRETGFVFNDDKFVTQKLVNNRLVQLTEADVPLLQEWGFKYVLNVRQN